MSTGIRKHEQGEVIDIESEGVPARIEPSALEAMTRAEVDIQIATAHRFPRSIKRFRDEAKSIACLDENVAKSCIYALPRGGKMIEGPSVRLAEIIAHTYGNLRTTARITQQSDQFVVAQAMCIDLERNNGVQIEVRRRVLWKNRSQIEDATTLAANAAISFAFRNAVFRCVPASLVDPIYQECRKLVSGHGKSIEERRENVAAWLKNIDVTPSEMFAVLGIGGWDDVGLNQMATLGGLMTAIDEGQATIDQIFRPQPEMQPQASSQPSAKIEGMKQRMKAGDKPKPAAVPDDETGWQEGRE